MFQARSVGYLVQMDALRAVAFLAVFAVHGLPGEPSAYPFLGWLAVPLASTGKFGVDVFFALSGYLITKGLLQEREDTGRIAIGAFYIRRSLRIWPLYFVFLGIALPLSTAMGRITEWPFTVGMLTFTGNFVIAVMGPTIWSLCPLWSLCVEEQFYLVWPHIVRRVRAVSRLALILLAAALAIRLCWQFAGLPRDAAWTTTFLRWDAIAAGVLLASRPWTPGHPRTALVCGALALFAADYLIYSPTLWAFSYTAAAAGGYLIVAAAPALPAPPPWLVYSGKISFGLYIFHGLALQIGLALIPAGQGLGAYRVAGSLALTFLLAALSYRFIEGPFLALKDGVAPRYDRFAHAAIQPRDTSAA